MDIIVYLYDTLIILTVGVVVVALLYRLKVPPIAGFIVAGMIVGPKGLGIIGDVHQVEVLAEIGVALLLFGIGLELSLDRLKKLWRAILIGGSLQVGLTAGLAYLIAAYFKFPPNEAFILGCMFAISSTAIVLRGLQERGEVDAPHGKITLGILVFQDLCVVPMMLLIPVLAGKGASTSDLIISLLKSAAIVTGIIIAARIVAPSLLNLIAKTRQRQLFVLTVIIMSLGTALLISIAGVSLALGAFLAGIVVAGSKFRHQALSDVIPFREVFTSIFFVSIGMLMNISAISENVLLIIALFAAILILKPVIVILAGIIMRMPLRASLLAGVALAQVGEFSFVLSRSAFQQGLISETLLGNFLTVTILTMIVTPILLASGPSLAAGAGRINLIGKRLAFDGDEKFDEEVKTLKEHVIIGGYGFAGEELSKSLRKCGIKYIIVDLNIDNVNRALSKGEPAMFGDITSVEVLESVGLHEANEFVIVINDTAAVEQAILSARELSKEVHIITRANYIMDIEGLKKLGANEVISAEKEGAVQTVATLLKRHCVIPRKIDDNIERIRDIDQEKGYPIF
ncbi:MAG: potassium transporter KefB [candidate division Zixibacteria bacterium]|nr:potassium transporter KefB [candidate division Zixibacteria bacterium]